MDRGGERHIVSVSRYGDLFEPRTRTLASPPTAGDNAFHNNLHTGTPAEFRAFDEPDLRMRRKKLPPPTIFKRVVLGDGHQGRRGRGGFASPPSKQRVDLERLDDGEFHILRSALDNRESLSRLRDARRGNCRIRLEGSGISSTTGISWPTCSSNKYSSRSDVSKIPNNPSPRIVTTMER